MARVVLENVYKKYLENSSEIAVNGIDLTIKDQEFMVLVGPSGCGKTTTLRMIAGLETVTSGKIYINDQCVNDMPSKDRDIAMVFQNYALFPHMTIYDNMAFGLKRKGLSKDEINRRIEYTASVLSIENLLNRKPDKLSGGQKQRVALGRAMVINPAVFLMDEPLSNLDAKLRVQMRTELIKLQKKLKATFIYVTHDQTEAMTMGSRICVMNNGVIQQVDTPQMIYDYPANTFVASFIGLPQINLMQGELTTSGEDMGVIIDNHFIKLPYHMKVSGKLKSYFQKKITIGIRPETIMLFKAQDPIVNAAKIEMIERLGSHLNVHLKFGLQKIVCKVSANVNYTVGETCYFSIDEDKIHLFDCDTGQAIL